MNQKERGKCVYKKIKTISRIFAEKLMREALICSHFEGIQCYTINTDDILIMLYSDYRHRELEMFELNYCINMQ